MINYKSFKISNDAKLRIRTDKIIATRSSKVGGIMDIYVSDITFPFHVKVDTKEEMTRMIDYVWERHEKEEEEEE